MLKHVHVKLDASCACSKRFICRSAAAGSIPTKPHDDARSSGDEFHRPVPDQNLRHRTTGPSSSAFAVGIHCRSPHSVTSQPPGTHNTNSRLIHSSASLQESFSKK